MDKDISGLKTGFGYFPGFELFPKPRRFFTEITTKKKYFQVN